MANSAERTKAYRERKRKEGKRMTVQVPADLARKLKGHAKRLVDRYMAGEEGLQKEIEARKAWRRQRKEKEWREEKAKRAVELLESYGVRAVPSMYAPDAIRRRSKRRALVAELEDRLRQVEKQERLIDLRKQVLRGNRREAEQCGKLASGILDRLEIEWGPCEEYDVLSEKWKVMVNRRLLNVAAAATPGLAPEGPGHSEGVTAPQGPRPKPAEGRQSPGRGATTGGRSGSGPRKR